MKKHLLTSLLTLVALTLGAQTFHEWKDPRINAVNRAPMHSNYFAYESADVAQKGIKENSANFMSLNGNWKFFWVKDAESRPTDFWKVGFNDKGWNTAELNSVCDGIGDGLHGTPEYDENGERSKSHRRRFNYINNEFYRIRWHSSTYKKF